MVSLELDILNLDLTEHCRFNLGLALSSLFATTPALRLTDSLLAKCTQKVKRDGLIPTSYSSQMLFACLVDKDL